METPMSARCRLDERAALFEDPFFKGSQDHEPSWDVLDVPRLCHESEQDVDPDLEPAESLRKQLFRELDDGYFRRSALDLE